MDFDQAHACIEDELNDVERVMQQQLVTICSDDDLMTDILNAFFSSGGKRLRPRLVLLSALAIRGQRLSGRDRETMLALATIVELVHSASLMHDDVLDRAATRRGLQSLNARFGDKVAILAGDILYTHAFEMLMDTAETHTTRALIHCVRRMCRGEVVNLTCRGVDAYESVIEDKTALLMEFCCETGARTGRPDGNTLDQVDVFRRFGHSFGMVYQLADDLDDDDVSPNAATRPQIRARLRRYQHEAITALNSMPPTPYRDGLAALLDAVAVYSRRTTTPDHPNTTPVRAGA